MSVFSIIAFVIFVIYIILFLIILKKHRQSYKFILLQAAISLILMTIINLTGFATNLHIPVNECTVSGVSFGGVPFLVGFLILRYIFVL